VRAVGPRTTGASRGRPARAGLRADILRTAEAVFMGRDFHAVVMDDIAQRCGVGKGTLYRYFPNKQELFYAVMRDGLGSLLEQLRSSVGSATPPAETLAAFVRAVLGHFAARPGLASLIDREESKRGVAQTTWFRRRAEVARLLEDVIADGIRKGDFRRVDPRLASQMLLGMIRAMNRYRAPQAPIGAVSGTVITVFLGGITRPDDAPPRPKPQPNGKPQNAGRSVAGTRRRRSA
jgi:AcrR family transcriptional regulator